MAYVGIEMLSVGRTVIRGICERNNNGWNVIHQFRESFRGKEKSLCWCGAIRYTIVHRAQTVLDPGKNINF